MNDKFFIALLIILALLGFEIQISSGLLNQEESFILESLKNGLMNAEANDECGLGDICHLEISLDETREKWDPRFAYQMANDDILSELTGSKVTVVKARMKKRHLHIWYHLSRRVEVKETHPDTGDKESTIKTDPDFSVKDVETKKRLKRYATYCTSEWDWECSWRLWFAIGYWGLSLVVFIIGIIVIKFMFQPKIGMVHGRPTQEQPTRQSFPYYRWWYLP